MKFIKKPRVLWYWLLPILGMLAGLTSCQDNDWLNVKRNKADVMPETLADLQAVMDNHFVVNLGYPVLGQISSDNVYVPDDRLNSASTSERNAYVWAKDLYEGGVSAEFANPNERITYANIVLERIGAADEKSSPQAANIRGQALFLRAFATYQLTQLFCKTFNPGSSSTDLGVQLRYSSDPNTVVPRSSVQQTYDRILQDATEAALLLTADQLYTTRPSSAAAHGLLAKVHLVMGSFELALREAQLALQAHGALLDFNSELVEPKATYRFPAFNAARKNPEILFYAEGVAMASTNPSQSIAFVDSLLYGSYQDNDLRKTLFYTMAPGGLYLPVGRYTGTTRPFTGIAVNELYLIMAECQAREGNAEAGMQTLNLLLKNRFKQGTFSGLNAVDAASALRLILAERRKELAFTGQCRWEDLRRLSGTPDFSLTLKRDSNGKHYTLDPGDKRYVFPFPDLEIQLSGIVQNER